MNNINVFENPKYYRKILLNKNFLNIKKLKNFEGKSLICVFFTAYCGVGCPFCFFHSPNAMKNKNQFESLENHFSEEGVEKFIKFANDANVGYLQISGGGEPFLEKQAILKSIENIKADRIILVTSGSWAYNEKNAEEYLTDLYNSYKKNKNKPRLTIRLSLSKHHSIKLKEKPLVNLINIFQRKYLNENNFTLQLKIFEKDNILEEYLNKYFEGYKITLSQDNGTDDDKYIKIMPWKYILELKSGYKLIVGKSRIFNSNLRPNLNNKKSIKISENIYDTDLELSQKDYPSIVYNSNGKKGIDWIVEYNGNVCTWQNRIQDNLLNIYEDDYKKVKELTFKDLITYSYIDKGSKYRENIINEISKKTVSLMKSVNIRDYAGTLLFEDEKIRLYYNIRVLQDYLQENKINTKILKTLPEELIRTINMNKKNLIKEYKKSNYSILEQELDKPLSTKTFHDFLELVKLGHYELSRKKIKQALKVYNQFSEVLKINNINKIKLENGIDVERRLTRRLMERKKIKSENKETYFYLCRHGETNWNVEKRIKGQSENIKTFFTEHGISQINDLEKFLKKNNIEAIFTSDLNRAIETSNIVNKNLNLPLYYYKNFRGLNMGKFQGKLMSEFLKDERVKKAFIDYDYIIPGGESINQLNTRYLKGLDTIRDNYNFKNVAIISHGAAISNIKSKISGEKYEDIDFCIIKKDNNEYKVLEYGKYQ